MTDREKDLLEAAKQLRDDMLMRAGWKRAENDGDLVVEAGNGVWFRFNKAIEAYGKLP